ncbi:tRNA (adenosine(37)-N6)-threonylcarbamoyltransferase complex dimerization subunit type 1 TsaB [Aliiglaciecola litoralis]|uniref:tRNA threonylcarbamoyladenosine biosynthesis protein TsaB n=1 Tax=Aliiglaciecola litoralis TaxID=582857 RepID=A0ABP3X2T0_9ALTE
MKLLAIDTATEACSAALSVDSKVDSRFEVCPQQHSQKLLPMVDDLLKSNRLRIQELDYLVFGRGPGSFTGVRIATGLIQGLSLGIERPVAAVSTLAAMAQQAFETLTVKRVAVAIDARMDEVYFAQYECIDGVANLIGEEAVLKPNQVLDLIDQDIELLCGTGWQAYSEFDALVKQYCAPTVLYPNAIYMVAIAKALIASGDVCNAEQIKPVYLRDTVTWKKLPGRE